MTLEVGLELGQEIGGERLEKRRVEGVRHAKSSASNTHLWPLNQTGGFRGVRSGFPEQRGQPHPKEPKAVKTGCCNGHVGGMLGWVECAGVPLFSLLRQRF